MFSLALKPSKRQRGWLSDYLLHSAKGAELVEINGVQYAQLEHPLGGPLTCVKNPKKHKATDVVRIGDKWCWVFDIE